MASQGVSRQNCLAKLCCRKSHLQPARPLHGFCRECGSVRQHAETGGCRCFALEVQQHSFLHHVPPEIQFSATGQFTAADWACMMPILSSKMRTRYATFLHLELQPLVFQSRWKPQNQPTQGNLTNSESNVRPDASAQTKISLALAASWPQC